MQWILLHARDFTSPTQFSAHRKTPVEKHNCGDNPTFYNDEYAVYGDFSTQILDAIELPTLIKTIVVYHIGFQVKGARASPQYKYLEGGSSQGMDVGHLIYRITSFRACCLEGYFYELETILSYIQLIQSTRKRIKYGLPIREKSLHRDRY